MKEEEIIMVNSLVVPHMGRASNQSLSRSSSGSAPGSATAPYASSVGSPPFDPSGLDYSLWDKPGLNFVQAEQDFQLQLALALRVAAEAAAVDDPDLGSVRGPRGMSPYVWSMCTDSSELGRMPPLENLQAVSPEDRSFEVV